MNTLYLLMAVGGVLVALGLVAGLYSHRFGLSHLLVFLVVGMAAGVDGPLGLPFSDHALALAVGNVALALILLDGGLRTPWAAVRRGLLPAGLLATVGVGITAAVVGVAASAVFGLDWRHGLLMGAVLASTDASAVFAQLSASRVVLPPRLLATIEVESGLNDPLAMVLTLGLIALVQQPAGGAVDLPAMLLHHLAWGLAVGLGAGGVVAALLRRLPLGDDHDGLTALLLAALGLTVFAALGLLEGSGFLGIYIFGLVLRHRADGVVRPALPAMNGYTWLAQAGLFLLLGLLVTPHEVWQLAGPASGVAGVLMLLARPLAVVLCLAPLRFAWREQVFVAWVGLRGAVPIVLATYPVLAGLPGAYRFFDVAFVVVLSSLLLQGPTLGWLAQRLRLAPAPAPAPTAAADAEALP